MNFSSFKRWTALILRFLAGQGSVQVLNLVCGFLLLRWLSVEAYAQYSVAFGFQNTLGVLVDLGISGSIVALVGDRGSDKEIVGTYIQSAKHFRNRFFAVIIPLAAIAFPLITSKHNWDLTTQLLLFISVASSLFFQGWVSFYSAPLLINQRLRQFYQPQIISSFGRLLIYFILHVASALTSWASAWVSSAMFAVTGFLYRQATTPLITEPKNSNHKFNREMIHYFSPLIPATIFTAFQGQISLALITIFGQTQSIAEVAALGRLGQLFFILSSFNSIIIGPYIAKVAQRNLTIKYFQILGSAVIVAVILCLIAFLFPQPLLWVLGPKYQNLRAEVGWVVVTASFTYVANTLYQMNSNRKWIYWWASAFDITVKVVVQIICIYVIDFSTTINVIYFSLIVAASSAFINFIIGIYGLAQNRRLDGIKE